ncbi:hypothetical protein [Pseudomonas sp. 18175]|uniref:hypothetical protein n=1 Tax=Pseudomonas sp. 18175 TaxID=3390056 RepID=UPI003D1E3BE6
MSLVGKVKVFIGKKKANAKLVPKTEFAAHISIGERYITGGTTLLVTGKTWELTAGSDQANVIIHTVREEN